VPTCRREEPAAARGLCSETLKHWPRGLFHAVFHG
jgi:hypothetical protein